MKLSLAASKAASVRFIAAWASDSLSSAAASLPRRPASCRIASRRARAESATSRSSQAAAGQRNQEPGAARRRPQEALGGLPVDEPVGSRRRTPVFEIDQATGRCRRLHPPPDGLPEQQQGLGQGGEPVIGDFLGLDHDRGQALITDGTAVEQEPDSSWLARAGAAEIHAYQPAVA